MFLIVWSEFVMIVTLYNVVAIFACRVYILNIDSYNMYDKCRRSSKVKKEFLSIIPKQFRVYNISENNKKKQGDLDDAREITAV